MFYIFKSTKGFGEQRVLQLESIVKYQTMELGTRKDVRVSKADFSKKSADRGFILMFIRQRLE
jgi:hypothetical protein